MHLWLLTWRIYGSSISGHDSQGLRPSTRYFGSPFNLSQVGLLPAGNRQQVPFAYKMYTHDDDFGWKQSEHFKRTFSVDVKVDFLGAW